jgi:PTS system galactitol-specific IIB component
MGKKVITVCGSGVATSVMCAVKIRDYCKEQHIDVTVTPISFGQYSNGNIDADVIVSMNAKIESVKNIPIVSGVALLTGIGQEQTLAKIAEILKK